VYNARLTVFIPRVWFGSEATMHRCAKNWFD
jgi:hypothetical protein